jgi:YD repeat-containing protein
MVCSLIKWTVAETRGIGKAVAKILGPGFGCKLLGYDLEPSQNCRDLGVEYVSLTEVLANSDVVSLHKINVGTGNLFETQTDFTAAPETQLSFTRYYNSLDTSTAGLGVGWHSTYHRGLSATASAVTITRADGRQDIYAKTASGYVPDSDVTSVLTPEPATGTQTGWKLKLDDDSTETYTLAGLLTSITTRAGLTTTLTYNANGQLTTVTGPFAHKLLFTYDSSNRVKTMTVPDGEDRRAQPHDDLYL